MLVLCTVFIPSPAFGIGYWQNPVTWSLDTLNDIDFVNEASGWAVANDGVIATHDGGESWFPQSLPVMGGLLGVDFIDVEHGWAVGGDRILSTSDGGSSWDIENLQLDIEWIEVNLYDVTFADPLHGWICGAGYDRYERTWWGAQYAINTNFVLVTGDGGSTWDYSWLSEPYTGSGVPPFTQIQSVSSSEVWGLVYGRGVRISRDGGATWAWAELPMPDWLAPETAPSLFVSTFCVGEGGSGWIAGNVDNGNAAHLGRFICRTTDGGRTWTYCFADRTSYWWGGDEPRLTEIAAADANHVWAFSYSYQWAGTQVTEDGGKTWADSAFPFDATYANPVCASFPTAEIGFAARGAEIIQYGPDPVRRPAGAAAAAGVHTDLPVVVFVAGLESESSEDNPSLWGWLREAVVRDGLAADVLIAPTAKGATAPDVIDSQGNLLSNIWRLASFLEDNSGLIGGRPVVLVGHSMGGVIARGLASHSSALEESGVADQISGVIQFGSPNAGAETAAEANGVGDLGRDLRSYWIQSVGWAPEQSMATVCLEPGSMSEFNTLFANTDRVTIHRIGGAYLPAAVVRFTAETGRLDDLRLDVMKMLNGITNNVPSDGSVTLESLNTTQVDFGNGWFVAVDAAHGAGLPGCRDSGWPMTWVYPQVVPQSGDELDAPSYNAFVGMMRELNRSWAFSVLPGVTSPPAEPAKADSRILPGRLVSVGSGTAADASIAVDAPTRLLLLSSDGPVTVTADTCEISDVASAEVDGAFQTSLLVTPAAPGTHVLTLGIGASEASKFSLSDLSDVSAEGEIALFGFSEGGAGVSLKPAVREVVVGDPVPLSVEVVNAAQQPAEGTDVTVTATNGDTVISVECRDDGLELDDTAGDGIYSGVLNPSTAGMWTLVAACSSDTFERMDTSSISVGSAEWATVRDALSIDVARTSSGLIESWAVRCPLAVMEEGDYTFQFDLMDAAGRLVAQPASTVTVPSSGEVTITAGVAGREMYGIAEGVLTAANPRVTRLTNAGDLLTATPDGIAAGPYVSDDFDVFGVSLAPLDVDPSPSSTVEYSGTAVNTRGTVASVEYSLDGGLSWAAMWPSDGAFEESEEQFYTQLTLPDCTYGILVRCLALDGTELPPVDWAGDRFTIDTTAPGPITGIDAVVGEEDFSIAWHPCEASSLDRAEVAYEVAMDGVLIGEVREPCYAGSVGDRTRHEMTITPVDGAGNRGSAQAVSLLPLIRYEQTDPLISYEGVWTTYTGTGSSVSGAFSEDYRAATELTFTGTRLDWITLMGPRYGIASVSVDGAAPVDVDLYAPDYRGQQRVWSTGTLPEGEHTLRITWTGRKNEASAGTRISTDVFAVNGVLSQNPVLTRYEQTDPLISYEGVWTTYTGTG
ncbi:MAG: hypothetical protein JXB46_02140, partial [Candidatus Eisenbacteria bacterium]|nr:hypothetical protein [Candidatus Eisenbacteria bacterium]